MKKEYTATGLIFSFALFLCACQSKTAEVKKPLFIDTAGMNTSIKPGDDFYDYVNGTWIKKAVIPASESSAGSFLDLYNRAKDRLHEILDSSAKGSFANGSIEQKVGDFYTSGMDSAGIEKLGFDPLKPSLQKIDAIKTSGEVVSFIAEQITEGNNMLIGTGIGPDDKNSSMNIAAFSQAGLGLPDRDYYFKTDKPTLDVVKAYQHYVQKIFMLTGDDSTTAAKKMMAVYNLEKQLAASHKTNVELRDPQSNYHKMAVAELNTKMPAIGWLTLFNKLGFKVDSVNVQQPAFYTKLNEVLKSATPDDWKAYLRFHLVSGAASALSTAFVQARFEYRKVLTGQTQMKPRWERIYLSTDANLGDPLGELYVKKYFTADSKKRMLDLVNNLQTAFEARISKLDWMSDSTKKVAIDKLHAFIKKIGYTDKWRDYSKVAINKNAYFENLVACAKNEYQFQLSKLGKPVDRTEWGMTAPTVNAYYNPSFNEIVFPAGILQSPFFDPAADDAINYGAIGMVIGHEMTHGFDDQGAQYDKDGNLKNWWGKADNDNFKAKTKMIIDQYNKFTVLDTLHINGALTTGENMADFGGLNLAWDAFKMTPEGKDTTRIDGLTPNQRFFLSYAQIWRSKYKDEIVRQYINLDPHSPDKHRVNGPLMHFTPFYTAFGVKEGDKMFLPEKDRIKIW